MNHQLHISVNGGRSLSNTIVLLAGGLFLLLSGAARLAWSVEPSGAFSGELTATGVYSSDASHRYWAGLRYLPQLNYQIPDDEWSFIDFDVAANLSGSAAFNNVDDHSSDADAKEYRAWARYSSEQSEMRLGLQKINFGSATILRPLQWFDSIDPRDPQRFTEGVWGGLGRYYFLDNSNVWFWVLYGNDDPRGLDRFGSSGSKPEAGGRAQYPVPSGEIAVSYNHRTVDLDIGGLVPENKFGLDGKWDLGVGLWFELTHAHRSGAPDALSNETHFMLGSDYTFGVGNGLNLEVKQLDAASRKLPHPMCVVTWP